MLPVLQVGPLAIQLPGLILLIGLWLGLSLAERHAAQFGVNPAHLYNLVLIALISGIVGARLVYAARYPSAFAASPLSLLSLNPGLFDLLGGAAVGLIAALIYGSRKQLPLLSTLDSLVPLLAVMAVANGLANLASGSGFGTPTRLPWGIDLWGATRHPTQIYETLAAIALLWIYWPGQKRFKQAKSQDDLSGPRVGAISNPGTYFFAFTASSAAVRLFLEAFRGDSDLTILGLRIPQLLAWVVLAACLLALIKISQTAGTGADSKLPPAAGENE